MSSNKNSPSTFVKFYLNIFKLESFVFQFSLLSFYLFLSLLNGFINFERGYVWNSRGVWGDAVKKIEYKKRKYDNNTDTFIPGFLAYYNTTYTSTCKYNINWSFLHIVKMLLSHFDQYFCYFSFILKLWKMRSSSHKFLIFEVDNKECNSDKQ